MSSAAARRAGPQSPMAYAAAKAGIEILTKELAAQAGPDGVRVNCLAPETILTERNLQQIPEADPGAAARAPPHPTARDTRRRGPRRVCSSPRTSPRGSAASRSTWPADPCSCNPRWSRSSASGSAPPSSASSSTDPHADTAPPRPFEDLPHPARAGVRLHAAGPARRGVQPSLRPASPDRGHGCRTAVVDPGPDPHRQDHRRRFDA